MLNDIEMLQKENAALKLLISEQNKKLDEAQSQLATYESFISIDEFGKVESTLSELAEFVESHGSLGTVSSRLAVLDKYEESGTLEEIDEAAELLSNYSQFGSYNDLCESMEILSKYEESGTLEEIDEASDLLDRLAKLGTLEEFAESKEKSKALDELGYSLSDLKELSESRIKQERDIKINELCESFDITENSAGKTLDMFNESVESAREYLSSLNLQKHKKFTESNSLVGKRIIDVNRIDESREIPMIKVERKTLLKYFN